MKSLAKRCTAGKGAADRTLVLEGDFEVKAGYTPLLQLPKKALASGCYVFELTLAAAMNENRQSTYLSKAFVAGPAAKVAEKAKAKAKKATRRASPARRAERKKGRK